MQNAECKIRNLELEIRNCSIFKSPVSSWAESKFCWGSETSRCKTKRQRRAGIYTASPLYHIRNVTFRKTVYLIHSISHRRYAPRLRIVALRAPHHASTPMLRIFAQDDTGTLINYAFCIMHFSAFCIPNSLTVRQFLVFCAKFICAKWRIVLYELLIFAQMYWNLYIYLI